MKPVLIFAFAGAALAADPAVVREGAWWVSTLTGAESVGPSARLHIGAQGDVTVAGAQQNVVSYALRVRVKAGSEAEARTLVKSHAVKFSREGAWTALRAAPGRGEASLDVKAPHRLAETAVTTSAGSIQAFGLAGSLTAFTGGGGMKADRIGGNVRMRTGGGEIRLGTIEGSADCATGGGPVTAGVVGGEAFLETGAGDITVDEVGGLLRAGTSGGAVRVARAGGVVASTGGGPIEVGEARGEVNLRNSGGPVRVGAAAGVKCENAAGAIRLANVSGSLRASTAIGSILAQLLAGRAFADSFLTTGRGDITVVIPSNVGVRVYAEVETASNIRRIVSDFPGIHTRVRGGQVIAEGDINGGGPVLRILGTGGTIFIKRQ